MGAKAVRSIGISRETSTSVIGQSERQAQKLEKGVEEYGDRGLIHALWGRASNCRLPEEMKGRVFSFFCVLANDIVPAETFMSHFSLSIMDCGW